MSEQKSPKTHEMIQHFLDELQRPAKALTEWEENFLRSVSLQYELKSDLSWKQFEILERIYAEKTA
jgi:hypothetical protein